MKEIAAHARPRITTSAKPSDFSSTGHEIYKPHPADAAYSIFGLRLRSNVAVPGLTPLNGEAGPSDAEIRLGRPPCDTSEIPSGPETVVYISPYTNASGEPALRISKVADGKFLHLVYTDGVQFWLDRNGRNLWAIWPESSSLEDAATYLLGPVLGLVLQLRGITCLHASAVAFGNKAIAFAGPEGAGKSTTAAALARRGHAVLSDDVVALTERDGAFFVSPAYPYLSLWPDSVNLVYGPDKKLPRFSPNWEKRQLSLPSNGLQLGERPLELGAIYVLGDRCGDPAPFVEKIPAQTALLTLVANSYATNFPDRAMRAMEFSVFGRLVTKVKVRRVHAHERPNRLEELCRLLWSDFQTPALRNASEPSEQAGNRARASNGLSLKTAQRSESLRARRP